MPISKKMESGALKSISTGVLIHALCMVILSAVAAALMLLCENPLGLLPITSLIIMPICATASSIILMRTDGRGSVRILSALAFVLIIFIISVLMRSAKASVIINYLCYLGVSALALAIPKKSKKRSRSRRVSRKSH